MIRRLAGAALLAAVTLSSGCYKNTIGTDLKAGGGMHEEVVPFFLWGIVGEGTFNLDQLCPAGVSQIEERQDVPEVALACLTLGIYSPVRVTIYCAGGQAWNLEPVPEGGYTLAFPVDELAEVSP